MIEVSHSKPVKTRTLRSLATEIDLTADLISIDVDGAQKHHNIVNRLYMRKFARADDRVGWEHTRLVRKR